MINLRYTNIIYIIGFVIGFVLYPGLVNSAEDKVGDVSRGSKEWANNCSRCHNMRDPKEFRDDKWHVIVYHMRVRAGLTGQQTRDIIAFLQSSNYLQVTTSGPTPGRSDLSGKEIYSQTCVACHGADGKGAIPGVPSLTERLSKSDAVLLDHIINGFQSPGSPMAMPARGGNANLTDQDIEEVLSYIRGKY